CFIATATFGSPMAEEVIVLREFRDAYLIHNSVGRRLVELYERYSPRLATYIAENSSAKAATRFMLRPIVFTVKRLLVVMIGLLISASSLVVFGWSRRSGNGRTAGRTVRLR